MFFLTLILRKSEIWSSEHPEVMCILSHHGFMLFLKLETLTTAGHIGKERIFHRNNVCVYLPRLESKLGKPGNLLKL